ncbi:hypothetical protein PAPPERLAPAPP_05000 [Brevundimonas phage vB_BpoS-Papperlapapp]|uniref:Uncharacterized protein n=1 Tax=Brevundimonas phage vB_BpoS-Domovoi TaxID=2948598 RepID=A0A9E7MRP4_9CAUD|nr:hypothetical protein DOMOVOI_03950 [Brevundimonas phage vB_BpoS-Domovoi]USN16241.1 hypothetical protein PAPPERLAPAPP_05000 [Brevundimonas phage vB_BpoS-Papperlapapp]
MGMLRLRIVEVGAEGGFLIERRRWWGWDAVAVHDSVSEAHDDAITMGVMWRRVRGYADTARVRIVANHAYA